MTDQPRVKLTYDPTGQLGAGAWEYEVYVGDVHVASGYYHATKQDAVESAQAKYRAWVENGGSRTEWVDLEPVE